jgi:chain length determinant protein tyrosine kinase EpsG
MKMLGPRVLRATEEVSQIKDPFSLFDDDKERVVDRSIGDFLRERRKLSELQVNEIVRYQREHRVRFGDAAIALRLADSSDVVWALSRQFHYTNDSDTEALHRELTVAIDPFSEESEIFRDMRSQLLMGVMAPSEQTPALAVVSSSVGDGKSFFAANMAVSLSQVGGRTLLIDADMRTPRQHELFGVPGGMGLSNILAGRADSEVIHQVQAIPNLYVLAVGVVPPNPLELIQRPAFGLLLRELKHKFDHVVVDTPAASHGADCRVLAAKCGAALVIGRRDASRMDAMRTLINQLGKSQTKLAGVMINEH